jgi:hypothetical protein
VWGSLDSNPRWSLTHDSNPKSEGIIFFFKIIKSAIKLWARLSGKIIGTETSYVVYFCIYDAQLEFLIQQTPGVLPCLDISNVRRHPPLLPH